MAKKSVRGKAKPKVDRLQSARKEISALKKKVAELSPIPGSITWRSPRVDPADDPSWDLVKFALNLEYNRVPEEVLDYTKRLILDTLGLGIAGSSSDTIPELVELVKGWGGREESPILVYGGRVPAPNAAFVLGPMIRALDMGETHPAAAHLCEHIVPSLLATLGLRDAVTGKEFMNAFIAAAEVGARVGDASFAMAGGFGNPTDSDLWAWRPPNSADMGAVLGVARLLHLDAETTHRAMGIQHWAVGARSIDLNGNLMMRYQHAFLCHSALCSVLLAQRKVTGPKHIFAGPTGYLALYYPWKNDIHLLTKDLGKKWSFAETSMKVYMGCFFTHAPMTGMEQLRNEHAIQPEDIAEIEVSQSFAGYNTVSRNDACWNPKTVAEAQFSMPYTLATMATHGNVFIDDYTPEALARPETREMITKIKAKIDDTLTHYAGAIKVVLKDGKEYAKRVDFPKGHPVHNPVSWDEVIQKFKRLLPFSKRPIPAANAEQVIEMVRNLEECRDVNKIVELLIP